MRGAENEHHRLQTLKRTGTEAGATENKSRPCGIASHCGITRNPGPEIHPGTLDIISGLARLYNQRGAHPAKSAAQYQRDIAARTLSRRPRSASGRHRGSISRRVAIPGIEPARRQHNAITVSIAPAAAIVWPKAHLNAVTGGISAPKMRPDRGGFGLVGVDGAVAVRRD